MQYFNILNKIFRRKHPRKYCKIIVKCKTGILENIIVTEVLIVFSRPTVACIVAT